MRVIPIANQAGSAGKTSTAVTLAALLVADGHRVLLIDADGQANASVWLEVDTPAATTGDVLHQRVPITDAIVPAGLEGLSVLAATQALDADAVNLARALGGEQRLRLALDSLPADDRPDVVLIDCPGAMSILTIAALVAATGVITVAQPTIKELAGVPKLEATVAEVAQAYRPGLVLGAVIPCIVPPSSSGALYHEALALLQSSYGDLVTPPVRRSVRIPEAYAQRVPLPVHAPRESVTDDYRQVAKHLTAAGILP